MGNRLAYILAHGKHGVPLNLKCRKIMRPRVIVCHMNKFMGCARGLTETPATPTFQASTQGFKGKCRPRTFSIDLVSYNKNDGTSRILTCFINSLMLSRNTPQNPEGNLTGRPAGSPFKNIVRNNIFYDLKGTVY